MKIPDDYKNSILLLDSSIRIGKSFALQEAISASLIELGNIYLITGDYQKANGAYDSALHIALSHGLNREAGVAYVNLAQFQANNDSGIAYLRKSLDYLNKQNGAEEEQINCEINLAMRLPETDSAIFYYRKAIGRADTYHLPIQSIGAYNNLVYKYLKKGKLKEAEQCLRDTAIPLALSIDNYDWLATLYDTYSDVLIRKHAFEEAVNMLRKSIETRYISDRIIAEKQVRILNAALDLKNKNILIATKEKLIIQKDSRIAQMGFWLVFAGLLILTASGGIFWTRQRAQNKLQQEKLDSARKIIEAEEREKEQNAMELHDSMNILITKVNTTIQDLPQIDLNTKKVINTYFEEFASNVRAISHRLSKRILEKHPLHSLIKGMCEDAIHYSHLKMIYRVNDAPKKVPADTAIHIIRIIQELLTNARKYALDSEINLVVRFEENAIELEYSDHGPGFTYQGKENMGMGVANVFARAKLINGTAVLDTEPGQGVYWKIAAPISKEA